MNQTPLENYLLELVKKTVNNDSSNSDRSKSLHATQLTAPCMRRQYYDLTRPKQALSFETAAVFRVGQIIHSGIILSKDRNEYSLGANIRTMEPIEVKDINPINFFDCVTGTIDDLMNINGEEIIVDKKTFSSVTSSSANNEQSKIYNKYLPKDVNEDYVNQLNIYKLLYYIKTKKEVKRGVIIYLDVATRLKNTLVFEIQLDTIENIKAKVLVKLDLLKSGKVPPRVTSWRCDYCPHATKEVCDPEQDPTFKFKVKK